MYRRYRQLIFWLDLSLIPKIPHQVWVNFQKSGKKIWNQNCLQLTLFGACSPSPHAGVNNEGQTPENYS